jgi:hypothetical protein
VRLRFALGRPASAVWAMVALVVATPAAGQEPPDTVPPDTVPALVPDPLADPEALQEAPADSLQADSLVFHALPALPGGASDGPGRQVWRWERDEILGLTGFTLLELLEGIPGLLPLRYGDYGAPEGVLGPGLTGGRVRVFLDGFEAVPLDGSIPDLSRVSLGALSEIRVERAAGELRIFLTGLRPDDPRPLSVVEAGTGDLETNLFRATFLHPRALGGSFALSLERYDTRGPRGAESGSRQGLWVRYALHRGDDAGIAVELRRSGAAIELAGLPPSTTRTDWTVRGRVRIAEGVVGEAFTGQGRISSEPDDLTPVEGSRRQHGLRLGLAQGPVWARVEGRVLSGPDLPSWRTDLALGGELPAWGGVALDWGSDRWEGRTASTRGMRAWTRSLFGLSAFAAWESGSRGARRWAPRTALPPEPDPDDPPPDDTGGEEPEIDPLPTHHFSDLTTVRVGARAALGPFDLTGSWIRSEADSLVPLGLLLDRTGRVLPGEEATGFEVTGRLALPVPGFALVGSLLQWDEEGVYRPRRQYQGGLEFHDIFYPSQSLEIRAGLLVEGRDPMLLPLFEGDEGAETPVRVPFYQSWQAHLQIRVQTVRIFARVENTFVRRANQDYPDRILPATRAMYGLRWTLWN